MYLHIGSHCIVKSSDIIGIFNLRGKESNIYKNFIKPKLGEYEIVDLAEKGVYSSCILTTKTIYLSGISSATLKRRKEEDFGLDAVFKR